jgi:ABC-type dipeptide/oligopeptide/nickel transport system permease component
MVFVLASVSIIVFWLVRGEVPPVAGVAPYITPRMTDPTKLATAQALGFATSNCPTWSAFTNKIPGCIVPLQNQYFTWLENVLKGNFGFSLIPGLAPGTSTLQLFGGLFPVTAELAIAALVLTVIIAFPLGVISATHNNKWPDHLSRIFALSGYSVPIFWLAFVLQILFVLYISIPTSGGHSLNLLPGSGDFANSCYICFSNQIDGQTATVYSGMPMLDGILSLNFQYFWDGLVAVILPAVTLAVATIAALTRILRSSMLDSLRQDYILLARSKGLKERTVIYRHALKNAVLPAITITGLIFAFLLGGVVVVEAIFTWPGVGRAAVEAATAFDVNFLELYVLITAMIIVLANLSVDVLYAYLDPRIRY